MSNKLANIIAEIQYRLNLSQEEIADRIGYSRPYLSNAIKKDAKGKILDTIMKEFAEIVQNVPTEKKESPRLVIQKDEPTIKDQSIYKLVDSNKALADANKTLSLTNYELALLLKKPTNAFSEIQQGPAPPFEVAYHALLRAGVVEGKWKSEGEGQAILDNVLSEIEFRKNG